MYNNILDCILDKKQTYNLLKMYQGDRKSTFLHQDKMTQVSIQHSSNPQILASKILAGRNLQY
jgi:hypothetical protein